MIKERYKKYAAIIQRAKEEGLHVNDKLSVLMDIESADRKFNIRLDEWLQADLFNFTIDSIIIGYHYYLSMKENSNAKLLNRMSI